MVRWGVAGGLAAGNLPGLSGLRPELGCGGMALVLEESGRFLQGNVAALSGDPFPARLSAGSGGMGVLSGRQPAVVGSGMGVMLMVFSLVSTMSGVGSARRFWS